MGLISNGTTIFDNGSMASGFGGSLKFISKATASASASIEFTSGIDSTYKEYVFYFVNLHTSASSDRFEFIASSNGGSSYGIATTSTAFMAEHFEGGDSGFLGYRTGEDVAQSTGNIPISENFGSDNDQSGSGYLHLFNPSSTTFVKHFIAEHNSSHTSDYVDHSFNAGYINTTSAINAIKFLFNAGNIDSGEILLFGIN